MVYIILENTLQPLLPHHGFLISRGGNLQGFDKKVLGVSIGSELVELRVLRCSWV
jgi:hypothetical protein